MKFACTVSENVAEALQCNVEARNVPMFVWQAVHVRKKQLDSREKLFKKAQLCARWRSLEANMRSIEAQQSQREGRLPLNLGARLGEERR